MARATVIRSPAVWLGGLVVAFVALGALQSFALPIFEAPDEGSHFFYLDTFARTARPPGLRDDVESHEAFQPPLYYALLAPVIAPLDRSDAQALYVRNKDWWEVPNVANQYVHGEGERWPLRGAALAVHAARLATLAFGAGAIVLVYGIASCAARAMGGASPQSPEVIGLLAAAVTAFNPKFVHVGSVVNNDMLIVFASLLACWWMTRLVTGATRASVSAFFVLGAMIGAAGLSKVNGFGLLAPAALVLALTTMDAPRNRARTILGSCVFLALGVLAVGGWWMASNMVRDGFDPLGMTLTRAANASLERATPLTPLDMLQLAPRIVTSYWGLLGLRIEFGPLVDAAFAIGLALAVLGCASLFARASGAHRRALLRALAPCAVWALVVVVSFVGWLRSVGDTDNSRLLLPTIGLAATLVALGWSALVPRRAGGVLAAPVAAMAALCVVTPFAFIQPAFATPDYLTDAQLTQLPPGLSATFGGQLRLVRAELDRREAKPGQPLRVSVWWGATQPLNANFRAIVEALDGHGDVIARTEAVPFGGRFATSRWAAGQIFRDDYALMIDPSATRGVAEVKVGVRDPYGQPEILAVDGARSNRVSVGKFKVDGPARETESANAPSFAPGATFGDAIRLEGVGMNPRDGKLELTLAFSALRPPARDFTLFVHALDRDGKLIAQSDGQPHDGGYPTSFWGKGERIVERRTLEFPLAAARVNVGWYDPATGERLAAVRGDGGAWRDNVVTVMER